MFPYVPTVSPEVSPGLISITKCGHATAPVPRLSNILSHPLFPPLKAKGLSMPFTMENIWQDGRSGKGNPNSPVFCASVSPLLKLTSSRPHNPRQQRKNAGLVGFFPQPRETQWGTVTACPSQLRPYTFRADSGWELSPSQCVLFCLYSRNQSWPLGTGRAASGPSCLGA